jgi:peptidoglycan/xylan/chitin deacetylase (PgdA/CDA1 family)
LKVICSAAILTGCSSARVHQSPMTVKAQVPILLYHHIEDLSSNASASKRRWTITPKDFQAQMDWIEAQGYHAVTIEQLMAYQKRGKTLPAQPIVLTFDDGWKDHYLTVLPILKQHHFVATFFVIAGSVGNSAYMDWQQVQGLASEGMDVQSHTMTHPRLSTLSQSKAHYEIFESKKVLEKKLNKAVTVLAYPFGSYDDDVIAITKAAGYEGAATVSGLNGGYLWRSDRTYTLDRYAVENGDSLAAIMRMKRFK